MILIIQNRAALLLIHNHYLAPIYFRCCCVYLFTQLHYLKVIRSENPAEQKPGPPTPQHRLWPLF